ncbi:hypothetical protein DAPPUDRAFT_238735 [Daphnia pulex]|uniref:Uncharacterized protein n=1 Tax=Daphnia pulex TaxID=6669 RepID=E9G794_DAPPU|nr:hypothetical protein DAPPUDRAFT_238735 [Daphnia pulex]|eukprot:EFX84685.1 hypothetical protein DAPPUDRAFT_238735 [Daphnia pulex]
MALEGSPFGQEQRVTGWEPPPPPPPGVLFFLLHQNLYTTGPAELPGPVAKRRGFESDYSASPYNKDGDKSGTDGRGQTTRRTDVVRSPGQR